MSLLDEETGQMNFPGIPWISHDEIVRALSPFTLASQYSQACLAKNPELGQY